MFKKIFTVTVFSLLANMILLAQVGKVTGKVTDTQTGEPLIGANIIILDTDYGAATDVNGEYTIVNVPPGQYNLRASFIGYQAVTIQNIRVVSGLTQEVNFQLPSVAIATEEVVIVSERPLIEKSSTNAVRIIDAEDLETLPVRTLYSFMSLQPGIVLQDNNIYIRGSRPDETGYMVEGANVKNVFSRDGGAMLNITPDAIQEVLIQAGGYTAEYGNANAGLVTTNFITGKDKYHFSVRLETDNFGNYPSDQFLDTYSYGYSDYTLTGSGPLFTEKVKFFVSGENFFMRDYNPVFFEGNPATYSDGSPWETTYLYDNGIFGGTVGDSAIISWKGGNVPGRFQNRYTVNGNVLIDLNPFTLKLSAAFDDQRQRFNQQDNIYILALDRLPLIDLNNLLLTAKGIYTISPTSWIEGNFSFFDTRSKTYDPYFEDDIFSYDDSLKAAEHGWVYNSYTTPPQLYNFNGFPYYRPGSPVGTWATGVNGSVVTGSYYNKQNWNYWSGSLAYTLQFGDHQLKAGGSYENWTIRRYRIGLMGGILSAIRFDPDASRTHEGLTQLILQNTGSTLQNYGYDLFGNESDAAPYEPRKPVFASFYVQDKVELSDFIINGGLRYDYLDMDSWRIDNLEDPVFSRTTWTIPDSVLKKTDVYQYVSPRLGFSFPVTDRTVFHLQYGKFVQSPGLDVAYKGITLAAHIIQGGTAFNDVVGYNLEPIRTTQYEIGFTQQFADFAAFDMTAFYKDIKGQITYNLVETVSSSLSQDYPVYINQDFATTKGLELSLRIRRVERIRAELNYTYSDSRGTGSGTASGYGAQQQGTPLPTVIIPLDYDQTHRGTLSFDYRFGENDGGPILERLGLNLLFTFNSGHPFTQMQRLGLGQNSPWTGGVLSTGITGDSRANFPVEPINSSTTPWVYNVDLRLDKTVSLFDADFNFYIIVRNLLNTKNVENVYLATGNAYDDGFLQTTDAQAIINNPQYGNRFVDLYRINNLENRQATLNGTGLDLFSTPRQIRVGLFISY
jgi:hypothetical protein